MKSKITTNLTNWTQSENCKSLFFRIDESKNRIYRKTVEPCAFGGYVLNYVAIDTLLANEWIKLNFGE